MRPIVGVLVVLLAGCSASAKSTVPTSTSSRAPSTVSGQTAASTTTTIPDATKIGKAMLTLADFPTGWATDAADASSKESGFCGKPSSRNAAPETIDRRAVFAEDPTFGPLVQDWVIVYSSGDDAQQVMAATRAATSSCTSWKDQGDKTTIDALSFPAVGDESQAYRLGVDGTTIDIVDVREGRSVIQVTMVGLSGTDLTSYVDKALAKELSARF